MVLRGRYDAASTNADNARHWANADGLSADAAASPDVRRTLRDRARYEVANNSYAHGIVETLANDSIGTGPRLQLLTDDAKTNRLIEQAFSDWAGEIDLAGTLRTMRMAKATDGEAFAMLTANPELASPIKLDVRLVEADRVTNPTFRLTPTDAVDGIVFDGFGNPTHYLVLRNHPGGTCLSSAIDAYDRIPAEAMLHWFGTDRPGQHRGVPEITPALPLFAQLRRYTLAVLGAAETAADFAAVLFTDAPAAGEATTVEPMDIIELEQRMATVLPDGWKLGQIKAEQPGTTYGEFKHEILNGPLHVVRKSILKEISFVDSGADPGTSARIVARTKEQETMDEEDVKTTQETDVETLEASADEHSDETSEDACGTPPGRARSPRHTAAQTVSERSRPHRQLGRCRTDAAVERGSIRQADSPGGDVRYGQGAEYYH